VRSNLTTIVVLLEKQSTQGGNAVADALFLILNYSTYTRASKQLKCFISRNFLDF